jgi:hypothetical protein
MELSVKIETLLPFCKTTNDKFEILIRTRYTIHREIQRGKEQPGCVYIEFNS